MEISNLNILGRELSLGPDGPYLDQQPDRAVPRRLPFDGVKSRMKAHASEKVRAFNLIGRFHVQI